MPKKSFTIVKKAFAIAFSVVFILLVYGCATLAKGAGKFQDVPVNSDPQGANVVTNSGYKGVTPCVLNLEKNRVHVLEISKKGYETTYITLKKSVDDSSAGNFLVAGLMGVGIDNASGARYKLVPEAVNVKLIEIASDN